MRGERRKTEKGEKREGRGEGEVKEGRGEVREERGKRIGEIREIEDDRRKIKREGRY